MGGVQRGQAQISENPPGFDQIRDPPLGREGLPRHGGVVAKLAGDDLAQEFMLRQIAFEHLPIGQFRHLADGMGHHHRAIAIIDIRLARQAQKRGKAGASGQHPKAAAWQ